MSSVGAPRHDPVPIGVSAEPPFAKTPDPATLFASRAERLRALADGHVLAPYLRFLASLSDVQHRLQDGLAQPDMPAEAEVKRAREFGMPPLDRGRFTSDPAFDATLERLLALSESIDMPEPARAALARTKAADDAARNAMVRAVLEDAIPVENLADHLFVAAALQVHFARQAAHLNSKTLCPSATVSVRPAARRRSPRWSSAGKARTTRASAPAHCARPNGTMCASNARCAVRLTRSATSRLKTGTSWCGRKPATAAAAM